MANTPMSPNAKNYKIGGVRLYVRRKDADAYNCLGNIVGPSIAPVLETLDHFTSWSGTRKRDRQEVTTESYSLNFTLDEFTTDNLVLALRASSDSTYSQSAATNRTNSIECVHGRAMKLDRRSISDVTVAIGTTTYTEYDAVADEGDYIIDYELGIISFPAVTAIANSATVTVTFDCAALTGKNFNPGTLDGIQEIDGIIIAFLDNKGGVIVWEAVNGTLQTNGDISLTDTDWSTMPMTIAILATNSPTAPYGTISQWV